MNERDTNILSSFAASVKRGREGLTERELMFVRYVAEGAAPPAAARLAGFESQTAADILRRPEVIQAIEVEREKWEVAGQVTKKKVLDGLQEAIDIARIQADSPAMIAGWREIGRLCGYYEPTKHQLQINVSGQLVVQRLQTLTDEELLRLAEGNVIEGEIIGRGDDTPTPGVQDEPE